MSTFPTAPTDRRSFLAMYQTIPAEESFHLERLPTVIAIHILEQAHNPLASGVCRKWRDLNFEAMNALWNHMQPILLEDPLLASYIQSMHLEDLPISGKTKFHELIRAICDDLQDVPALSTLSQISPLSLGVFQKLSTLAKDVSLQKLLGALPPIRARQVPFRPLEAQNAREHLEEAVRRARERARDRVRLLYEIPPPVQEILEWLWNVAADETAEEIGTIACHENLLVIPDELRIFHHVQYLFFAQNKIRVVSPDSFQGMSRLIRLDLASNQICSLPEDVFQSLISLNDLDLKNNHIAVLSPRLFRNLTQLKSLDLSYNDIAEIPAGSFDSLQELEVLSLSHNRIASLSVNLFRNLRHLSTLDWRKSESPVSPVLEPYDMTGVSGIEGCSPEIPH